jgi:putative two-component system response regulator
MAIADAYDALTNERPYKKAFSHEESVEIIKDGVGSHFDPLLGEVFLMHHNEFRSAAVEIGHWGLPSPKPQSLDTLDSTVKVVSHLVDSRDGQDSGQLDRIRRYLTIFLNAMRTHGRFKDEVSSWNTDIFLVAAQLYDVGKIVVADRILNKAEKLTEEEFEEIKNHADLGLRIIQHIKESVEDENFLYHAEALTGNHHEKWDGTGYPLGLKGQGIPLQGRVMAIVDVYDALSHDRPYRDKIPHKQAIEIIRNSAGTSFDPDLVEIFLDCEKEFESVGSAGSQA